MESFKSSQCNNESGYTANERGMRTSPQNYSIATMAKGDNWSSQMKTDYGCRPPNVGGFSGRAMHNKPSGYTNERIRLDRTAGVAGDNFRNEFGQSTELRRHPTTKFFSLFSNNNNNNGSLSEIGQQFNLGATVNQHDPVDNLRRDYYGPGAKDALSTRFRKNSVSWAPSVPSYGGTKGPTANTDHLINPRQGTLPTCNNAPMTTEIGRPGLKQPRSISNSLEQQARLSRWASDPFFSKCEPCTGARVPCRTAQTNCSNVNMNHGFGTFISESKAQFGQVPCQTLIGRPEMLENRTGFSLVSKTHLWPESSEYYKDKDYLVDTAPQRYNPWPRFFLGHQSMIQKGYRPPPGIDYQVSNIARATSENPFPHIH